MKFRIKKNILDTALSFIGIPLFTSNKNEVPDIIKNIYIECENNKVNFYGTDLENLFSYTIENTDPEKLVIESSGECLLLSKSFVQLVKKLSDDQWINFELKKNKDKQENNTVVIKSGRSTQKIICDIKVNYPKDILTIKEQTNKVTLPASIYHEAINNVLFACGKDSTRPDLSNICLEINDNNLYFVSGSGVNLAVYKTTLSNPILENNSVFLINKDIIICDKRYYNLESGFVEIVIGKNVKDKNIVSFRHINNDGYFQISSTFMNVQFPDWKHIYNIPLTDNKASIPKKEFLDILNRVSIVSPNLVLLQFCDESSTIKIFSNDNESIVNKNCQFDEELDTIYNNINGYFYFNLKLLHDGIKKVLGDIIDIEVHNLNENNRLLRIASDSLSAYKYFILEYIVDNNQLNQSENNENDDEDIEEIDVEE